MKKNNSEISLILIYGDFTDLSENFNIKKQLIIEKFYSNKVITNCQTEGV